jgi:DNA-binding LytR/AlgR family response regulator
MKINCCIVDDEPLALDLIERYVERTDFLELKGKCSSAVEAIKILNKNKIDVLFLDIQMPDINGLEFSKVIDPKIKIIFTTAFDQYAIDGYKVNALDYLLKPISYDEFHTSALKCQNIIMSANSSIEENAQQFIFVKSEYKQVKIELNNILYIEGLKDYVKIWLTDQAKPILTIMSLKLLEQSLSAKFMRIHRSFIVALDKVSSFEKGQILIGDAFRITVAEQYKKKFNSFLSDNSF